MPMKMRKDVRLSILVAALLMAGCQSPNRGIWRGDFVGSVSGQVEFRINSRGTRLTGTMKGETRDGQPFEAEMEGKVNGDYFYASFEGGSRSGALPVAFKGFLKGGLAAGLGEGDWECELAITRTKLAGKWRVEQVGEGE